MLVEMFRTLQQLVSEVERVTGLQELLTRVASEKQSELSQSIQGGEAIAFDEVDILTPHDVLLVKGLSFKLEDGQTTVQAKAAFFDASEVYGASRRARSLDRRATRPA